MAMRLAGGDSGCGANVGQNTYILRSIGEHDIVIASLSTGAYDYTSAATDGWNAVAV